MKQLIIFICVLISTSVYAEDFGSLNEVSYVDTFDGGVITFEISGVPPIMGHNIPVRFAGYSFPDINAACYEEVHKAKMLKTIIHLGLSDSFKKYKLTLKHIQRATGGFGLLADVYVGSEDFGAILAKKDFIRKTPADGSAINWCN